MSEKVSLGSLSSAGVLDFGDGYRTKRSEHGIPGYRILRVADVGEGTLSPDGPDFVSVEYTEKINSKLSEPGDVLLTTKGTVGRVAIVPEGIDPLVYSPQLCYFRVREPDQLNARYLSYWFRSRDFLRQAAHRANNTDMAAYINLADIRSLELRLPQIDEQRAIAEVLGALDDKIAANTREIALTDDLAAALYEAALESDSEERLLADVAAFHNRRRVPLSAKERDARPGIVPYYGAAGRMDFVDEALFDEQLLLVGEDGSVVREDGRPVTRYIWGPSWVNNHAHVLTGDGVSTELLRLAVRRSNVLSLVTGAVQPKISMGNLKSLPIELPTGDRCDLLSVKVDALMAVIRRKTDENRSLTTTRDALLPLLMSGTVTVKDAESVVEEAV